VNELKEKENAKKIAWHTTFGDIEVQEHLLIKPGKQLTF